MCGTIDGKGNRRPRPPRRAVQTAGDTAPQRGAAKENDDDRTDTHPPGTLGNWQTQYQALQMTAREAAELIRDGDTAAFAAMSNWPWELDGALAERLLETGGHIAIYGHFIPAGTRLLTPERAG